MRPGIYQFYISESASPPVVSLTSLPFMTRDKPSVFSSIAYYVPGITHLNHQVCPEGSGQPLSRSKFLQAELLRYNSMSTKEYNRHFPMFFQDWCEHWPERAMFPELLVNAQLTNEQEEAFVEALSKCREVSNVIEIRQRY